MHSLCNIELLLFQSLASHATLLEADTRTPYEEGRDMFSSANNAGCSCSHEFPDSKITSEGLYPRRRQCKVSFTGPENQ